VEDSNFRIHRLTECTLSDEAQTVLRSSLTNG